MAGCELVGGETAEMPGTYSKNKFDLAGFAVGFVEKKIIFKNKIKNGNVILAIPSKLVLHQMDISLVKKNFKNKKKLT